MRKESGWTKDRVHKMLEAIGRRAWRETIFWGENMEPVYVVIITGYMPIEKCPNFPHRNRVLKADWEGKIGAWSLKVAKSLSTE